MGITIVVLIAAGVVLASTLVGRRYGKMRGTRLVICPENRQTAAVEVKAARAVVTGLAGRPTLRLADCSRWPEKKGCGQDCLSQIEAAPEGCLVRRILEGWYADKNCVVCSRELGHIDWMDRAPALLGPDGVTVEWGQLVPEKVPETLRTYLPVCFDCHISSTFRRRFGHLVVDRPWDSASLGGKH